MVKCISTESKGILYARSVRFDLEPNIFPSGSTDALNPLISNIHMQTLQTDLHTFPLRISCENLIKYYGIFSLVIILLILCS